MNKILHITVALALCVITLCSFAIAKSSIIGVWKWNCVQNVQTGEKLDIEALTMGMAKEVKTAFKDDDSYIEYKTKKNDNSVSQTAGTWKIESEGTVLNLQTKGKWTPSKIVSISADTLIVEMRAPMQLVMVREH